MQKSKPSKRTLKVKSLILKDMMSMNADKICLPQDLPLFSRWLKRKPFFIFNLGMGYSRGIFVFLGWAKSTSPFV